MEGWYGDDYLILFAESDIAPASERYAISQWLPGYQVVGLRGWDDFIVRDANGNTYCAPTVPLSQQHLSPFPFPHGRTLLPDPHFAGKIKWYVQPIALGGDAKIGANIIWVTHEEHEELVRWWNDRYRLLQRSTSAGGAPER